MDRRLAAILAADVAGYSRLVGADEEGTIARLARVWDEVVVPRIATGSGRVVKIMGDGLLAEFASVVDAVRAGLDIQRDMAARNAGLGEEEQILFRIGINLGDVVVAADDILGDGVNVAARLEALAEPGGICISRAVRDHVRDRLQLVFDDLGEVEVKNVHRPVRVFRLRAPDQTIAPRRIQAMRQSGRAFLAPAAMVVATLVLGVGWQLWPEPASVPADPARMALALPTEPSVAVLPFDNLSDDPTQDYLADGLTEDLLTGFSRLPGLFVIGRNSSFAYKGREMLPGRVAEELGVRYIMDGSVRRSGDGLRVNVALIDTSTGRQIWADRFEGDFDAVFSLQDTVTRKTVEALSISLATGDAADSPASTRNPLAYDEYLKGYALYRKGTVEDALNAVPHLERAVSLDPTYSRAYAALAAIFSTGQERDWDSGYWSMIFGVTPEDADERLGRYLAEAMKDPTPLALKVSSREKIWRRQHDEAVAYAERATELDPNDPIGHETLAHALVFAGHPAEAAAAVRKAMRLDPQAPQAYLYLLGLARFGTENYDAAAAALEDAVRATPSDDRALIVLAATYGHLGRIEEAQAAVETLNNLRASRNARLTELPEKGVRLGIDVFTIGDYALEDVILWPFKRAVDRDRLRDGLLLAGVPERGQESEVSPLSIADATTVDAAQAKLLHDRGVPFVDVRGDADVSDGVIPGAVHLDLDGAFTRDSLMQVAGPESEIVIYCMGPRCLRSSQASAKAIQWGYQRIYYFREGLPAWKAEGYPVDLP